MSYKWVGSPREATPLGTRGRIVAALTGSLAAVITALVALLG